jgi:hypothetical protein
MTIHDFYYNEDNGRLYVEFSTRKDRDKFYRVLELDFEDVEFYSPDIITEEDLTDIDESYIIEIITEYLKENELPDEIVL